MTLRALCGGSFFCLFVFFFYFFIFIFTDNLSCVILFGHSDIFRKYNKKVHFYGLKLNTASDQYDL